MLTSLSPTLLHAVRDAAALVHDLAQLGLEMLCHDCSEDHGKWLLNLPDVLESATLTSTA